MRNKSYVTVVVKGNRSEEASEEENKCLVLSFNPDPNIKNKRNNAYIREVMNPGESYNIQTHLEIGGFFLVKVILLGANLCLLEEMEEGIIQELLNDPLMWWKQWFLSIRPWQESDVDTERILWVRLHGEPNHV